MLEARGVLHDHGFMLLLLRFINLGMPLELTALQLRVPAFFRVKLGFEEAD